MRFFSKRSGSERRRPSVLRFLCVVLVLGATLGVLAGCSSDNDDSTLPTGTWTSAFGEGYEISTTTIVYSSSFGDGRTASIVSINDSGINGGDTVLGDGGGPTTAETTINPGYAVIRYTSPDSISGQYNIFRWGDITGTNDQKFMAEYFDEDPSFAVGSFGSVDAAEQGATIDAGSWFMGTYTSQ